MWYDYISFESDVSAITHYSFRYNFIMDFSVSDIFRYPISITLANLDTLEEIQKLTRISSKMVRRKIERRYNTRPR